MRKKLFFGAALATGVLAMAMPTFASSGGWKRDHVGWWYQFSNTSYAKSTWLNLSNVWYYMDGSGYMKTGWLYEGGSWYYLDQTNGNMLVGWVKVNGTWYFLNPARGGRMDANTYTPDGYYVDASGAYQPSGRPQTTTRTTSIVKTYRSSGGSSSGGSSGGRSSRGSRKSNRSRGGSGSTTQTVTPTQPTVRQTTAPTQPPTRQTVPTQPTTIQTVAPTQPTIIQTVAPTQPTTRQTVAPTQPTARQTVPTQPTTIQTVAPTQPTTRQTTAVPTQNNLSAEDKENAVIALVNQERARVGHSPIQKDDGLTRTADIRAEELATTFSHRRPDGSLCYTAFPSGFMAEAENIASGGTTAEFPMNMWMNSTGHKANILGDYDSIGVGFYERNGHTYWVQVFGKR